jgi:DNA-binding NarL/FixJ family response regulator
MVLKVLIADDHALLRQGLRLLLSDDNPQYEFAEAEGLDAALDILATSGADLLLIDLGMPDMAGAESLRALRESYPDTKTAVLTGSDDRATILECLGAGIHGYILKSSPVDEIRRAVDIIVGGNVYVTPALARLAIVAEQFKPDPLPLQPNSAMPQVTSGTPHFTSRQTDVLRLLGEGRSTKDIARILELGPGTVKIHLAAIFRTLGVRNRTEAAVAVARLNL